MIQISDAITLASAKLHSRRILTGLTILVSSILFGILIGGSLIITGIENSMNKLTDEAQDGRYLVKTSPVIPQDIYPIGINLDKKTVNELKSLHTSYIMRAKKTAKESNLPFDETTIVSPLRPSPMQNPALPNEDQLMINQESPVYEDYIEKRLQKYAENAPNTRQKLIMLASKYGDSRVYPTISARTHYANTVYLQDGMENLNYLFKTPEPHNGNTTPYGFAVNSVQNSSYQMLDDTLLQNWLLPPNEKRQSSFKAIPVIISVQEAGSIFSKTLNISKRPISATEQIDWIKGMQKKINGYKYTSCYRNDADRLQITQAIKDLSDIKANSGNPNFKYPKIIYELPKDPCGELKIKSDSRSSEERGADKSRLESQWLINPESKPQRKLLEFQVVGVIDMSESSFDTPRSIEDLATNLFNNNINVGALIPRNLYENSDAKLQYNDVLFGENTKGEMSSDIYTKYGLLENILAFKNLSSARKFIANEGCSETVPECNKVYRLDPFGSNYLLLDDIYHNVRSTLGVMLPIFLGLAGLIMILALTRVVIDSRQETAVFRALGAKRVDIVAVYITYASIVSFTILIISELIGVLIASVTQILYGASFTAQSHVAYGMFGSTTNFYFIGFEYDFVLLYALCILSLGLIAIVIPLFRNVRRNPLLDMRDDR